MTKPVAIPDKSSWHLEVSPKHPGYLGDIFVSRLTRTDREEESLQKHMTEEILRHVDSVGSVHVRYDAWKCPKCGNVFDSNVVASECCWNDGEGE